MQPGPTALKAHPTTLPDPRPSSANLGRGLGGLEVGGGLTDLVTVVGILHVVWVRRQWVQIILALSQQACCGETELRGRQQGGAAGALRVGPRVGAVRSPADSDSQDAYGLLVHKGPYTPWSWAGSLTSPPMLALGRSCLPQGLCT